MAELTTIARPYAQAVFKLAGEKKRLKQWGETLSLLAGIVSLPEVRALIGNPKVSPQQLEDLLLSAAGKGLDEQGRNLVRLLVENKRLGVLPEIAQIYDQLRAEAESRVDVRLTSAFELNRAQADKIAKVLEKRLGKAVDLSVDVDEALIGGVVIRAGDLVIDGSVAGELNRLANVLAQ